MNLFYQPRIREGVNHLDAEESRHCTRVLRKRAGDTIRLTDGLGFFYDAVIEDDSSRECRFRITATHEVQPSPCTIHIAVAPTKNADRIEWFVEKATEFGINRITLLSCRHSERTFIKTDRLEKVALSAMKQSLKASLPVITPLTPFDAFVQSAGEEHRFIAHVDESNPLHLQEAAPGHRGSHLVLIGPEGDFSTEELRMAATAGFVKVSLGRSRLRTETAALAACHILNLLCP